jgi:RNA-binding protein YlmH
VVDRQILSHLNKEEKITGARAFDFADKSLEKGEWSMLPFLDPAEQQVAEWVLSHFPEIKYRTYGGYKRAERKCMVIFPDYYLEELIPQPIAAIWVKGEFSAAPKHPQALGALTALGLDRSSIGDIIPLADGFQILVLSKVVQFVVTELRRIDHTEVTCEQIDIERLEVPPTAVKEVKGTVASLRLDAMAALGYGTSRTKIVRDIQSERVKVNWKTVTNPSANLTVNDVISIRGKGRVIVEEVGGTTKKGRISVNLKRLL